MEKIFEGLDSIRLADLCQAYGQAGDVPWLFKGLVSEVHDERQEALY